MNGILIITNYADDKDIREFAYQFALQNSKDLTIAQLQQPLQTAKRELVKVNKQFNLKEDRFINAVDEDVEDISEDIYMPRVKKVDASNFTERDLVALIRREDYGMVICGWRQCRLNLQTVLNQVSCPLMLLPERLETKKIERAVYLTDLRYCQQPVVSHLSRLEGLSLLVAHICQQGLPDLMPNYGTELFGDAFGRYSACIELFFTHIKEMNMKKVADTLINTMKADMLVCINRRFHFKQLLGETLPKQLPGHITVPVLIFPC